MLYLVVMPRVKLSPRHKLVLSKLNEEVYVTQSISHEVHYVFKTVRSSKFTIRGYEKFEFTVRIVGVYTSREKKKLLHKPSGRWVRFINKSVKNHSWYKCKFWLQFISDGCFSNDTTKVIWDLK